MPNSNLFSYLGSTPIMGQALVNVSLLRLDRQGGTAPGNKRFKLQGTIEQARAQGIGTLVSFGGAWSNHLHALAATGREVGLQTVGIVRGEQPKNPSAMLRDAQAWGMQLVYVSREEYRRRDEPEYIAEIREQFSPCLVVPEGGANAAGVQGCKAVAELLLEAKMTDHKIVLAVGTGTTLAGVAEGLGQGFGGDIVGISVLKGAFDLDSKVAAVTSNNCAKWQILHNHHCGGYARVSPGLRAFILAFEEAYQIPLDPVYTGKALYAVHQLLVSGEWSGDTPIAFIHTGGVQGRRGFAWLSRTAPVTPSTPA